MALATVTTLKTYVDTAKTTNDALLLRLLNAATRLIEGPTGLNRACEPWVDTAYYRRDDIYEGKLYLGDDLLAVTTLTNGDETDITAASYWLLPRNTYPKWYIELKSGYSWEFDVDGEVVLDGIWGWHTQYGRAWTVNDAVQNDPLSASGTSVSVTAVTNFEVGQFLKCESEFMRVTVVTGGASPTLTVLRGQNGSTAAAHVKTTPLYIWTPEPDTVQMCCRMAAFMYRLRDSQVFDVTASPELGIITVPKGMPVDVADWLRDNRKMVEG